MADVKNGRGCPQFACRFCGWRKTDNWPGLALHLATDHPEVQEIQPMLHSQSAVGHAYGIGGSQVGYAWHRMTKRLQGMP